KAERAYPGRYELSAFTTISDNDVPDPDKLHSPVFITVGFVGGIGQEQIFGISEADHRVIYLVEMKLGIPGGKHLIVNKNTYGRISRYGHCFAAENSVCLFDSLGHHYAGYSFLTLYRDGRVARLQYPSEPSAEGAGILAKDSVPPCGCAESRLLPSPGISRGVDTVGRIIRIKPSDNVAGHCSPAYLLSLNSFVHVCLPTGAPCRI